ncbi:MAG: sigma-70 family RNA polymerase sigma factor [Kiritimatiellae bacterium]|nr:sigma-70 family RNA polymerase sigma factor [Kiritimatiellia bacterium]
MRRRENDFEEPDGAIVRRVQDGDMRAYAGLVRRHQNELRAVLSFYCFSANEVEEFVQIAFVQAYTHLKQFDQAKPFFPWLRQIAMNALRMEIRRKQTAQKNALEYLRYVQMEQAERDEEGTDADTFRHALRQCVQKIPANHADLFRLKYQEKWRIERLAQHLKVSVSAVKVRLLRVREALRRCIREQMAFAEQ